MNKTYIVLLSSLIACSSMGMNKKPSNKEQQEMQDQEHKKLEAMRRAQQRRIEQFKKEQGAEKKADKEKIDMQQKAAQSEVSRTPGSGLKPVWERNAERKPVLKIEFGEMITFQPEEQERLAKEKMAEAWVEKMKKADSSPYVEPEINLMDVKDNPNPLFCDPHLKSLCQRIHKEITNPQNAQGLNSKDLTLKIREMIQSYQNESLAFRLMNLFKKNIERPVRLRVAGIDMMAVGKYGNCFATLSRAASSRTMSVWTEGSSKNWQKQDIGIEINSPIVDMMWTCSDTKLILAIRAVSNTVRCVLQGKCIEIGSAEAYASELQSKSGNHARWIGPGKLMGPERWIVDGEDYWVVQDRERRRWFDIEQLNEKYMEKDGNAVITITDQPTIEDIARYLCARAQNKEK